MSEAEDGVPQVNVAELIKVLVEDRHRRDEERSEEHRQREEALAEERRCREEALAICGFGDASTQAYAAVVYLVLQTNSSISVRFVVSKTRVAPLQPQTIPRLELLSALLL